MSLAAYTRHAVLMPQQFRPTRWQIIRMAKALCGEFAIKHAWISAWGADRR